MAITIKLNKSQRTNLVAQPYTAEAVEVMRAIRLRERVKKAAVTQPGEVFAILLAIGYQREDQMDTQTRAAEFVSRVRESLKAGGQNSPSYDQVLGVMNELGYRRSTAA